MGVSGKAAEFSLNNGIVGAITASIPALLLSGYVTELPKTDEKWKVEEWNGTMCTFIWCSIIILGIAVWPALITCISFFSHWTWDIGCFGGMRISSIATVSVYGLVLLGFKYAGPPPDFTVERPYRVGKEAVAAKRRLLPTAQNLPAPV